MTELGDKAGREKSPSWLNIACCNKQHHHQWSAAPGGWRGGGVGRDDGVLTQQ